MNHFATPEETLAWGRHLGGTLAAGSVVALCGQLGAGKTQVAKGIIEGLGSHAEVTSPTFSLVNEYRDGRLPAFHLDFYRLESDSEVLRLGWDDLLDENGVVVVEWADLFPQVMPEQTRWFYLQHEDGDRRSIREGSQPLRAEAQS